MAYFQLAGNQAVTGVDLHEAVNSGLFVAVGSIPFTIKCITCDQANNLLSINFVSGGNKLVLKQQLGFSGSEQY